MKTGKDVLDRALRLLGYTDALGEIDALQDAELMRRGTAAVLQIYADIGRMEGRFPPANFTMQEELNLSPASIHDVMPYGVAMLIAQGDGNGDMQSMYSALYNQKRTSVPRAYIRRVDVLPRGGW